MKRIISMLLVFVLLTSAVSVVSFADANGDAIRNSINSARKDFEGRSDNDVRFIFIVTAIEMLSRGLLSDGQYRTLQTMLDDREKPTYSFGKGTFVVGLDIRAGTYDTVCKSTDQDDYSNSMNSFSGLYSQYGMQDFADAFGSLGSMAESMKSITVRTISSKGYTDSSYSLKVDETARIILQDGMKLEIDGGSAELTFIR